MQTGACDCSDCLGGQRTGPVTHMVGKAYNSKQWLSTFFIFPLFGFLWGLKNLLYTWGEVPFLSSLLWFVGVLVFSLIIPGHILNYKARKENRNGEWGEV